MQIARSTDYGTTFGAISPPVSEATILNYDLKVGFDDAAHLAFDQFYDRQNPIDIDVRYTSSASPSYASWSAPVTVSDEMNGRLQGRSALAVQECNGGSNLHLIWTDSRLGSRLNNRYDIFYAQKKGGGGWSTNVHVSDRSSLAFFEEAVPPAYPVGLAVTGSTAVAVWPDRRDVTSFLNSDSDVFSSRIRTGTSCR